MNYKVDKIYYKKFKGHDADVNWREIYTTDYKLTIGKIYKVSLVDHYDLSSNLSLFDDDNQRQVFMVNSAFESWFEDVTSIVERKLKLERLQCIK